MNFHNYQRVILNEDSPDLQINDKNIGRVSCFNFLGLTINEFMNWISHSTTITNRTYRTLGVMNRLKRYLQFSARKLMYDSLILSHLLFGITWWGFEWNRIFKLQKRALRKMTNSKYNTTEPLFKVLEMLKVKNIFDVQCMKFWYEFVNNSICFLPGLSVLVVFWDIISQTCRKNILGPYPKGPTLTALNRLSFCVRHISLNLILMYVPISIVIPVDAMLCDSHCSKCMYKHLMNYISP